MADAGKLMSKEDLDRVRGWASQGGTPYNHALSDLLAHIDALNQALAPFAAAWLSQRMHALTRDPAETATNTFICWADLNRANAAVHGHGTSQPAGDA